jgi:hypothetical protein
MDYTMSCECNSREAGFDFKDGIMPPEVINRLYCPECSKELAFNPETMIADNGWVIEYDMDVAEFSAAKLPPTLRENLSPEILFDKGYATWCGIHPDDHFVSICEKAALARLAEVDPEGYAEKMKTWSSQRIKRLKEEGWRKANEQRV